MINPPDLADSLRELCDEIKSEQDKRLAELRKISDMIEALNRQAPAPELPAVPYRSQWDADAGAAKSDCGPAALAMLLDFRGSHVKIDDISKACGLGPSKLYTTPADLVGAGKRFGIELEAVSGWMLEQFAQWTPCIVLVHYAAFTDRQDQGYTGGHWVVLLGVRENQAIYHDPDWWKPRRGEGASRHVDVARFALAMRDCALDGNPAGMGLVIAH